MGADGSARIRGTALIHTLATHASGEKQGSGKEEMNVLGG
jgi:hypothetical protein